MKMIAILFLVNLGVNASTCESLRPAEDFFSLEYMIENFGAPNFDDTCFEDYRHENTKFCFEEVESYKLWLNCLNLR